ncbi:MAG TPA: DNA methylase [Desulfobulbaceae bacterium]|nr:DNA methylase [Desulfobulbaceae bacterium]
MAKNYPEQKLFDLVPTAKPQGPVECLGMTFENDEKRREYFLEKLREKLKDPEFRKIEGFPIGEDGDILALSDPPYYTACPNPFIEDFIKHYGRPYDPKTDDYRREPFAADVSEGKNDPIYNAHSYHTKVPYKAIMRYILHYTEPGDVVFDGFCGTGMTGVAAQMCGNRTVVESLGYKVKPDGTILRQETDEDGKSVWVTFSKLGTRRAVLNDLSPAATFIAYNYNTPVDVAAFEREAKRILKEVEEECGWMYETLHTDGMSKGRINYTVWSDVFTCPECAGEVVFWEAAVKLGEGKVLEDFRCPHCDQWLSKSPANQKNEKKKPSDQRRPISAKVERLWITRYDSSIRNTVKEAKQVPVLINYSIGKSRFKKKPDSDDLRLIDKIEGSEIPYWFPTQPIPEGDKTNDPFNVGITHVHQFYTKRNLWCLSAIWKRLPRKLKWIATSFLSRNLLKCNRFVVNSHNPNGRVNGPLTGTFYVPSEIVEQSAINLFADKILSVGWSTFGNIISTSSSAKLSYIPLSSMDYLFLDPPFGANIMYSELSFIWESWLALITNTHEEAVQNKSQKKSLSDYRELMTLCFKEAYRVLKPGRWMTVEFSNTKASVWNSIQNALSDAGFIVGNVSVLDKQHGGIKAMANPTNVKQDLIISAYKPNGGFEERFQKEASTEEGVWDFVRTHLKYLPVIKKQGGDLVPVPERDPRILFDQMVAYYVRKGYPVPISSQEFQVGLAQRFIERDAMFFLSAQAAEYDRKKMLGGGKQIQMSLFVSDEASAIAWLRNLIRQKPQTFQDINPLFMKEIGGWQKHEKALELSELLKENFLPYDGKGDVPSQIHSYLSSNFKELRNLEKDDPALRAKAKDRWYVPDPNKAGDLEKLRERTLLREFQEYRESKQKRLKVFRLEAVRAGFKKAWQERDYATIIAVARKIPEKILQEDPKILMWYDQAVTRMGGE